MSAQPRIGYIGIGLMGDGAAKNILERGGYPLTVMGHRNRASVDDLVRRGARETATPAEGAAAKIHIGCVAGALAQEGYLGLIRAAGFSEAGIAESRTIELPDSLLSQHLDAEQLAAFRAAETRLLSVTVPRTKPSAACCGGNWSRCR
jgi:hypothetical protein